jgi:hypothetical protein
MLLKNLGINMIKKLQIVIGMSLFFGTMTAFAQGAGTNDIDGDGVSDLFRTRFSLANKIRWAAKQSSDSTMKNIGLLGSKGNLTAVVDWEDGAAITRLSSSISGSKVVWSAKTASTGDPLGSFTFGRKTDTLITGADFDGDGLPDAVAVRGVGTKLRWFIKHSPLGGGSTEDQIDYGAKESGKPTYMDLEGDGDWLGVADKKISNPSQYILRLKNPRTEDTDTINLGTFAGTPEPIEDATGKDVLALVTKKSSKTRIVFRNRFGTIFDTVEFEHPGNSQDGKHVIGDFVAGDPGEEVAVQVGTEMKVYNPFSETTTTVTDFEGTPVGRFLVAALEKKEECGKLNMPDGPFGNVWKPNSDTQFFAVAIITSALHKQISSVAVYKDSNNQFIKNLTTKGFGNPDPSGVEREHFQDYSITGAMYKNTYGAIRLRVNLNNGKCLTAVINDPSIRVD